MSNLNIKEKLTLALTIVVFVLLMVGITPTLNTVFEGAYNQATDATYPGHDSVATFWQLAPFLWGIFLAVVVILALVAEISM